VKRKELGVKTLAQQTHFCIALSALLLALCAGVDAQQPKKIPRIGAITGTGNANEVDSSAKLLRQALQDLGYSEGKNILFEYRDTEGDRDRIPAIITELINLKVDVLFSTQAIVIRAAKQATKTIPIVMGVSADPVRLGFVKSLARPGGNTTGVATMQFDLSAKRLELFKEAIPTLRYVAVLLNSANPVLREDLKQMEVAGGKLGVRLRSFELVGEPAALQTVFSAILRERPDGLIVVADSLAAKHSTRIGEFAARNRLPAMVAFRDIVADGVAGNDIARVLQRQMLGALADDHDQLTFVVELDRLLRPYQRLKMRRQRAQHPKKDRLEFRDVVLLRTFLDVVEIVQTKADDLARPGHGQREFQLGQRKLGGGRRLLGEFDQRLQVAVVGAQNRAKIGRQARIDGLQIDNIVAFNDTKPRAVIRFKTYDFHGCPSSEFSWRASCPQRGLGLEQFLADGKHPRLAT
jgi:putative ABC transport system substrate-binding protein